MTEPATDEQIAAIEATIQKGNFHAGCDVRMIIARIEAEKARADAAEKRYELAHGDWLKAIERIADERSSHAQTKRELRWANERIADLEKDLETHVMVAAEQGERIAALEAANKTRADDFEQLSKRTAELEREHSEACEDVRQRAHRIAELERGSDGCAHGIPADDHCEECARLEREGLPT